MLAGTDQRDCSRGFHNILSSGFQVGENLPKGHPYGVYAVRRQHLNSSVGTYLGSLQMLKQLHAMKESLDPTDLNHVHFQEAEDVGNMVVTGIHYLALQLYDGYLGCFPLL